jgi:hypothetical protein
VVVAAFANAVVGPRRRISASPTITRSTNRRKYAFRKEGSPLCSASRMAAARRVTVSAVIFAVPAVAARLPEDENRRRGVMVSRRSGAGRGEEQRRVPELVK